MVTYEYYGIWFQVDMMDLLTSPTLRFSQLWDNTNKENSTNSAVSRTWLTVLYNKCYVPCTHYKYWSTYL